MRGYAYEGSSSSNFNWSATGFGEAFKGGLFDPVTTLGVGGFGECIPRWDNYVQIDPNVVDAYGIPVLHVHMTYGENERAIINDMRESGEAMMAAAGAKNIRSFAVPHREPGRGIHEVGVARMGNNPQKSVLHEFQQAHDIKNLFVCDGASFTSTACQNPTLTIMDLCVHSCDYLLHEMKHANV